MTFEQWWESLDAPQEEVARGKEGPLECALFIWNAALEQAAKVCEANKYSGYVPPEDGDARFYYNEAGIDCATAIRELKEQQ